jgi:hypothetical protein
VEPVELHRVFPPAQGEPSAVPEHALTEERLGELRALLDDMRGQRADMKADRDHWREQAQRLALSKPEPSAMPLWAVAALDRVGATSRRGAHPGTLGCSGVAHLPLLQSFGRIGSVG